MSPNIRRVELIANVDAGGVGPGAADEARAILAEFGLEATVRAVEGRELADELRRAVDRSPDLLAILAGDGTARSAVELCGPEGPLVAPLPGGTMNMLPFAIYGRTSWQAALRATLEAGVPRTIGGGEVDGRLFLVAAILGAPALWASAREAVRHGQLRNALRRASLAWRRRFSGRLRYSLDSGVRGRAEAVSFLCPLASATFHADVQALEVGVLTTSDAVEAFRLALNAMMGDWRRDPSVHTAPCQRARVWHPRGAPAVIDGEPTRLPASVEVVWRSKVGRVLAPPLVEPGP